MAPIHPEIQYAERSSATDPEKNIIYFTINAPDIKGEPKLEIKPSEIIFAATAGDPSKGVPEKEYAFDLQLYEEIIPEETRKITTSRAIILVLRKKELKAEYWLRLTKEKPNRNWIKTDFSKWVDEDEQDGAAPELPEDMGGMGGMDMGGMGGMPGMGGMGGMPGMGDMGGMDFAKMMQQMGGAGGMGGMGDDSDDDLPDGDEEEEAAPAEGEGEDKGKGKAEAQEAEIEEVE